MILVKTVVLALDTIIVEAYLWIKNMMPSIRRMTKSVKQKKHPVFAKVKHVIIKNVYFLLRDIKIEITR